MWLVTWSAGLVTRIRRSRDDSQGDVRVTLIRMKTLFPQAIRPVKSLSKQIIAANHA